MERGEMESRENWATASRGLMQCFVFRCRVQRSSTLRREIGHSAIWDQSGDRDPQGETFRRDAPRSQIDKRMHRARWVRQSRPRSPPLHSHIQFCISSNSSPNLLHALDRCGRGSRGIGRVSPSALRIFPSPPPTRMPRVASRETRAHEIRFADGSFVPTASLLFYLIDSRGMHLMRAWAHVLILCKRKIIYLYLCPPAGRNDGPR